MRQISADALDDIALVLLFSARAVAAIRTSAS